MQTQQGEDAADQTPPEEPQSSGNKRPLALQTDHPTSTKYPKWVLQLRTKPIRNPLGPPVTEEVEPYNDGAEQCVPHSYPAEGMSAKHRDIPQPTPSEGALAEEETSQIVLDSLVTTSKEEHAPANPKRSRPPMLPLPDPSPRGCTERAPMLTRYLAAYLSQADADPAGTAEGDKASESAAPALQRRTSDSSQKFPKMNPHTSDPNVTAFHDSLLHMDHPAARTTTEPHQGGEQGDESDDMEVDDPVYDITGIQRNATP